MYIYNTNIGKTDLETQEIIVSTRASAPEPGLHTLFARKTILTILLGCSRSTLSLILLVAYLFVLIVSLQQKADAKSNNVLRQLEVASAIRAHKSLLAQSVVRPSVPLAVNPSVTTNAKPLLRTLRSALKNREVTVQLVGDGESTSHVKLMITSKVSRLLRIVVPANEVFRPNSGNVQNMMVTKDKVIAVPAGTTVAVDISTVCVSFKSIKPPPPEGVSFEVGDYPNFDFWKEFAAILAATKEIEKSGDFGAVPLRRETRKDNIAQLAIWMLLGKRSDNPEDKVTREGIAEDMLSKAGVKLEEFPKEKQQQFGKAVDEIIAAVDLTIKRSKDPNLKVASLPSNSTYSTYNDVGIRAFENGDFTVSEELLSQAVIEAEIFGATDPRLATSMHWLAKCYFEEGKFDDAESLLTKSIAIRQKSLGPEYLEVGEALGDLGLLHQAQKKYSDAEKQLSKALAIKEKSLGPMHTRIAEALSNLAMVYCAEGKPDDAEPLLKRALAIRYKNIGPDTPAVAEINKNLASLYAQQGKYSQAEKLYLHALATDKKRLGEEHPYIASILDGLAATYKAQNKEIDAERCFQIAETIRQKTVGGNSRLLATLPANYETYERIANCHTQTEAVAASAKEIQNIDAKPAGVHPDNKTRAKRIVKDKWALVVGISKFADPSISLKYAAKDAQDFVNYLVKEAHFAPDHVRLLTNERATRENILAELGDRWLPHAANPDDLVVIFISSHGSPSKIDLAGVNYLVTYNTDKNSLYATGIPIKDLTNMVKERVHSDRVVMIMDACHSGAAEPTGAKGLFRISNFSADELVQGSGQLVICSSQPNQVSWESKGHPNGVFTRYLLEGLKLKGKETKLGDAYEYMKDKVQEEVLKDRGELQTPVLKSTWEGIDLKLAIPPAQARPGLPGGPIQVATPEAADMSKPTINLSKTSSITASKGVQNRSGKSNTQLPVKQIK